MGQGWGRVGAEMSTSCVVVTLGAHTARRMLDRAPAGFPSQIVHGDLKPGNVLVDASLHCYISDFGMASMKVGREAGGIWLQSGGDLRRECLMGWLEQRLQAEALCLCALVLHNPHPYCPRIPHYPCPLLADNRPCALPLACADLHAYHRPRLDRPVTLLLRPRAARGPQLQWPSGDRGGAQRQEDDGRRCILVRDAAV